MTRVDGGPEFVVDNSHTINDPLTQLINGRQGYSFLEASLAKASFLFLLLGIVRPEQLDTVRY